MIVLVLGNQGKRELGSVRLLTCSTQGTPGMGAGIVYGRDIALRASHSHDGREFVELVSIDGDYYHPVYDSVAAVVELCQVRGIPADAWPISYGVDDRDVPLDEVRRKCEDLRQKLEKFEQADIARHSLLQRVWEWLSAGEIFCVMD